MGISTPATKERSLVNARAATPKFISIPTPATKERAQISRKRKCIFDDVIVLPNKYAMVAFNCVFSRVLLINRTKPRNN